MSKSWEKTNYSLDVGELGSTLVVAPHPDDETLGCGGVIALLCRQGLPVHVMILSDGAKSHSLSKKFPTQRLVALREMESLTALNHLGVLPPNVTYLRLPDGNVPKAGSDRFNQVVDHCAAVLQRCQPSTVLLPWRRDPHCDHRASWELMSAAAIKYRFATRWLEYPIWLWTSPKSSDAPHVDEVVLRRFNITDVLPIKRQAVQAYQSQISDLIDDDPNGFRLSAADLAHFEQPWEVFFESIPDKDS